jgi:NAD+ diphosphatase
MLDAESVVFGTSGLDRAAEIRGDDAALAQARAQGRILPMWRGKPALDAQDALATVPDGHPILADAAAGMVFLGRSDGEPWFAADMSAWEPEFIDEGMMSAFLDPSEQQHPALPSARFSELRAIMTRLSRREAELAATAKAIFGWHDTHRFCSRCGARSDMAMAGWQRDCAQCGGKHFPRTDPVVIMLITHGNSVLVGRSPGWPEGMYSCLAGFVEPGETLENAVRREVMEESGVAVGAVSYLASQPWPFPASLMFGCKGEALDTAITLDPHELEDACWLTREEAVEVFAGTHPVVRAPRKGAIAEFLLSGWLADRLD